MMSLTVPAPSSTPRNPTSTVCTASGTPPGRPARRRGPPGTRTAPRGVARTSRAAPPAARAPRAVSTCSQPPSQDAPTSTPGTLGALLMRYPSQTCVRLAPQRRNSLTGTPVGDRQNGCLVGGRPDGSCRPRFLAGRATPGPPDASRVRNSAHLPAPEVQNWNSGMTFKRLGRDRR
jgi:hypothetical protein